VLSHLLHRTNLLKQQNENGKPAKRGHRTLCLAQHQALVRQPCADLTRDWFVRCVCVHPPVVSDPSLRSEGGTSEFRLMGRGGAATDWSYFNCEKSVGFMNIDSALSTILPAASDSFCALIHSGSLRNSAHEAVAASRLLCFRM